MFKYISSFIFLIFITQLVIAQIYISNVHSLYLGGDANILVSADFNNDGRNDLAVATGNSASSPPNEYALVIFYQDQSGQLNIPQRFYYATSGAKASTIDSGDFNNDQLTDIVVGHGDSISIFYQTINGIDSIGHKIFNGHWTESLKAGDLNNDGLMDIVTCTNSESYIRVFYQQSTGFSTDTFPSDSASDREIAVGDFNGDGLNDVVVIAGYLYFGIRVYYQLPNHQLDTPVVYSSGSIPIIYLECLSVADINNDGFDDIVAAGGGNTPDAKTVIWIQDPVTNVLGTPINLMAFDVPNAIEIADMNNDGRMELVLIHGGWWSLTIYEQDANNSYSTFSNLYYPGNTSQFYTQGICINDFDNNGWMDIAVADGGVLIYYCDATPVTGIDNSDLESGSLTIFPNPSSNMIIIKGEYLKGKFPVNIFDTKGKLMLSTCTKPENQFEINISQLPSGLYYLKINTEQNCLSTFFVKTQD
jgi:hypothetical protein